MKNRFKLEINGNFVGYFETREQCERMIEMVGKDTTIIWTSIEDMEGI